MHEDRMWRRPSRSTFHLLEREGILLARSVPHVVAHARPGVGVNASASATAAWGSVHQLDAAPVCRAISFASADDLIIGTVTRRVRHPNS